MIEGIKRLLCGDATCLGFFGITLSTKHYHWWLKYESLNLKCWQLYWKLTKPKYRRKHL